MGSGCCAGEHGIRHHEREKIASNLISRLTTAESFLEIEQDAIRHCDAPELSTNTRALSDEVFFALRYAVNDLHALSVIPPAFEYAENPKVEEERFYKKVVLPADKVLAFLEDDAIFVRTPMLWSRQSRMIRGDKGRTIGPERCVTYRDSVRIAIMIDPNFATYDFKKFGDKILHYLYVYHDLPTNKMYLTDNDNHESKHVTDAITKFLPGGDSPLYCSFWSSAALTDCIPEGTYVTVTRRADGTLPDDQIIAYWQRKYEGLDAQI